MTSTRINRADWIAGACGLILAGALGASSLILGYWLLVPVGVGFAFLVSYFAWVRISQRSIERSIDGVTPNLLLIAVPTLLAASRISTQGAIAALIVVLVVSFLFDHRPSHQLGLTWACALVPIFAAFIVLRPNYPSTSVNVVFFIVGCVAVVRAVKISKSRASAFVSLVDGVGLFVVVSVTLWLIGFRSDGIRTNGLENALTGGERVVFPLANSLAATPNMAAVYCVGVLPIVLVSGRHRLPRLAVVVFCAIVFALTDARVSLIATIIVAACLIVLPRFVRVLAPITVAATFVVPFVYASFQQWVGNAVVQASSSVPWLVRPGEEASSLNQRDYIWTQTVDFFAQRVDWFHQLSGFGAYGHAASGASASYASRFEGLGRDDLLLTPHNSALQVLLDGGLFVLISFAIFLTWTAASLARRARRSPYELAGLGMLLMLSVISITEVAISPTHAQPAWWVLLGVCVITYTRERSTAVDLVQVTSLADRSSRENADRGVS
ncbi:O-antigen ligase family protein [Gordonia alkanivorans]|uniref:O-antigen ligase family protein n=1 Tax=Gordonia alkanivorans TaxID=84096 RepID=UPI0024486258|nr:O-antigen ligase family protein [Gordonia alkanivorans]MDH3051999.1 O-antigen ligase family protein [Gordonia alkanivorans]